MKMKIVSYALDLQGTDEEIAAAEAKIRNLDACADLIWVSEEEAADSEQTVSCDICGKSIPAGQVYTTRDGAEVICVTCSMQGN